MNTKMLGLTGFFLAALMAGNAAAEDWGRHGYRDSYFVPPWATDVGDGWIIGSKPEPGGFAIYRWNGYRWHEVHGAGIRIGGSYSRPWHVNDRGHRYVWNGWEWERDYYHDDSRVFRGNYSRRSYDSTYREFRRSLDRRRLNDWSRRYRR